MAAHGLLHMATDLTKSCSRCKEPPSACKVCRGGPRAEQYTPATAEQTGRYSPYNRLGLLGATIDKRRVAGSRERAPSSLHASGFLTVVGAP